MASSTSQRRHDRGAASAQLVLLAPLLMLLLLLSVQAGLAWHAHHIAQTAASRGLASARAHDGSTGDGTYTAHATLRALGSRVLHEPTTEATRSPTEATVQVRGRVLTVIPGLNLTVTGHAAGPVERFQPPPAGAEGE